MLEKKCKTCGKIYPKKISCSKKVWNNSKYCSRECTQVDTNKNLIFGGMKGRTHSLSARIKIGNASRGSNNKFWRGGKSDLKRQIYNLFEYRLWRSDVFKRDNWICINCGKIGGALECHHIKGFSLILNQNNVNSIENAINCSELWDINNGQTLCKDCHKLTDNYMYKAIVK